MRTLVLVDGEHYPPVLRAAIDRLPERIPNCVVVAAAFLGGTEKVTNAQGGLDLGVPVVTGASPDDTITSALAQHRPDIVVDLSDEPVIDARTRLRLASRAMASGAAYLGADFRLDPPPRPRLATKPSIAVIGTGKRTGKTAVAGSLARVLAQAGRRPIVVAMGRGGPPEPELIDPAHFDLSTAGLLALADAGRHAASDHLEDALCAGVATIGTRRCGGGLTGAAFDTTFAEGVSLANGRPEPIVLFEGSGLVIPPAHADVVVCVVPATADPELVCGYGGAYRMLLSDVVVITMQGTTSARSARRAGRGVAGDAAVDSSQVAQLERSIRELAPEVRIVRVSFHPTPLTSISGRRVVYATTAPSSASTSLREQLERVHGAMVVGVSHHLANRPQLRAELEAMGDADVLLVELKAAAVDVAVRLAEERGMQVVFCDNRVESLDTDDSFEGMGIAMAELATRRYAALQDGRIGVPLRE